MDAERIKQVEEIYHAALKIPEGRRESFLRESCGEDVRLRREVEPLLAFEKTSDSFSDTSSDAPAAELFSEEAKPASLLDREIGHYKIIKLLGKGAMGEVYLAEDLKLNRKAAIKFLSVPICDDKNLLRRFEQEAFAASALNHPNILTIYEFDAKGEVCFLVAEYIEGETLGEHSKNGLMPLQSALDIAIQMASALATAHRAGIVHRDIKPDNVMIRPDGLVKILDFGIVKLSANSGFRTADFRLNREQTDNPASEAATLIRGTVPGMIMGTANYMSPEQARGKTVDARSDIFSFGIVFYEMLSRKLPFEGETAMDTIAAILHKEPLPLNQLLPELPGDIEQIVSRTLRKNADERYQNIKDVLTDLQSVKQRLNYEEVERSFPPEKSKAESKKRQNKLFNSFAFRRTIAEVLPVERAVASVSRPKDFPSRIRRNSVFLTILAIILVASGLFGYRYLTASEAIKSIAVLPFVNVGDDRVDEYLSDGLSENLINTLSRLPKLKVIARSSSFKFRGENIDVQDAAQKLKVAAILTGRVVRRADDLQISVELIDTADNTLIWGDTYNRKVSAALSVQEEIAHAVSEKLQLNLSGAQERQMAKQMTNSPQAYQAYMNGVFFRRKNAAENIRKAIEYQKQSIALDANFARAYTELSINFAALVEIGALRPQEGLPQARATAEKALALDETLAEAHYSIARVRDFEYDWTGAEHAFKRAIELNPNLAEAHTLYADYLSRSARFDEALQEVRLAQELDPLRTGLIGNEGLIFYNARRYDEAIAKKQIHAQLAAENPFAHLELANALVQKGQYWEAILSYQTSIKLEETTSALIYLGRVYALTDRRDEATAILDKLKTTEKYVSPTELAILYAALGDREEAFASLEKAFAERDIQLTGLKVEPGFDPLRDDARFADLLRRVGFQH